MADSLLNNIVLIQAYGFRRESVAVLVAAPYLLEYSGRSEYVPCTEARADSLFRKVGCSNRGRFTPSVL